MLILKNFLLKLILHYFEKIYNIFSKFKMFNPIKYAGTRPTSVSTEYLPPIFFLCSIKKTPNFFERMKIIIFFRNYDYIFFIFFSTSSIIVLVSVSKVFLDFEIIKKRIFLIFLFFLNCKISLLLKSSKK